MKLKNSLNLVWKKFTLLDMFQDPVHLNVKGQTVLKSSLGGLITLIIFAFLGSQAIIQTVGMFNRDSPQVIQVNEFQNQPGRVLMDRSTNFILTVSTAINGQFINFNDNSLLSFSSKFYQRSVDNELNLLELNGKIIWAPCNRSNFPSDIFPSSTYDTYYLSNALCPLGINYTDSSTGTCPGVIEKNHPDCLTPSDFSVQGTIFDFNYEDIKFEVNACNLNDSAYFPGLNCSSDAKDSLINSLGISFYLGFANNYIDASNYDSPNQTCFDYIEWNLQPNLSRTADLYVDMETVEDYDSFISTKVKHSSSFYSISAEKMREQQVSSRDTMLGISIQRSKLNRVTSRSYVKILDVVSNIGGLSELFIFIGAVIALGYARYKYYMLVSNELYELEKPIPIKKVASQVGANTSLEKSDQKEISFNQSASRILVPINSQPKDERSVKDLVNSEITKKKKLEYTELGYFKEILLKLLGKRTQEERLAEKARKKAMRDLDLIKIVEKLREIDKLKHLLLNQNQLQAFNFVKKPQIKLKNLDGHPRNHLKALASLASPQIPGLKLNFSEESESEDIQTEYEKLYSAYKQIKSDKKVTNRKYNEKLISMLDEDVVKIFDEFDKQQQIKKEKDSKKYEKMTQATQDEPVTLTVTTNS